MSMMEKFARDYVFRLGEMLDESSSDDAFDITRSYAIFMAILVWVIADSDNDDAQIETHYQELENKFKEMKLPEADWLVGENKKWPYGDDEGYWDNVYIFLLCLRDAICHGKGKVEPRSKEEDQTELDGFLIKIYKTRGEYRKQPKEIRSSKPVFFKKEDFQRIGKKIVEECLSGT
jgi:hypothetical protein